MSAPDNDDLFELGLEAFRQERGTVEQRRELERRLVAVLGPDALDAKIEPATGPQHLGGGGSSGPVLMKPIGAIIGAVLLAGVFGYAAREPQVAPPATVPHAAAEQPRPQPAAVLPAQSVPQIVETSAAPQQADQVRRPPERSSKKSDRPSTAAPDLAHASHEDELALLLRARNALRSDASAALSLAEQHARSFPKGSFVQEREVLAINALLKQHRTADAFARADRFLAAHEGSSYAMQLRAMLATKPLTGAAGVTALERIEP